MSLAKVTIVGNVGKDAEFAFTETGIATLKFNVAVNRKMGKKPDGTPNEKTFWFRCTIWRQRAEALQGKILKGQKVVVIGDLSARAWTDNQGSPQVSLDVDCSDFDWGSSANEAQHAQRDTMTQQELPTDNAGEEESGDIPF